MSGTRRRPYQSSDIVKDSNLDSDQSGEPTNRTNALRTNGQDNLDDDEQSHVEEDIDIAKSDVEDGEDSDDDGDNDPVEHLEPPSYRSEMRRISFGALADAQASIPSENGIRKRKHSETTNPASSEKLQALRDRLADLRDQKEREQGPTKRSKSKHFGSLPREEQSRSSKHAPHEQTSKRAVTRKRPVLELSSNPHNSRDPRFSAAAGHVDLERHQRNYSFLSSYRDSEIETLKEAMRKTKDPEEKAEMRRAANAMENRARAEKQKSQAQDIIREHRKKEREAIKQGKKPFFMKKSILRDKLHQEQDEKMSAKDKDKAARKKLQKESQKERKAMPAERRTRY